MDESSLRASLSENQSAVESQGFKDAKASKSEIDAFIEALSSVKIEDASSLTLEALRQAIINMMSAVGSQGRSLKEIDASSLKRIAFLRAVDDTHFNGGVDGLFDHVPPGVAVQHNVLAFWHQHFVLEENMLEVKCPSTIKEYSIVAPDTKNPLFQTSIGSGLIPGFRYLRPEIDQGIFVKFEELYCYNGNELPFAAAQIGQAFRNDIAPGRGLLSAREFTFAEIKHFVDPLAKSHPKYHEVADLELLMFPRDEQMSGQSEKTIQIGEAVPKGIVNNETLGYFIGRVYLFLTRLGIDKDRLRFRQHLPDEMAHYAADCWVAEIESSYGWIECVGISDRSAPHLERSGAALVACKKYPKPIWVEKLVITPVKKELGIVFKGNQKMVAEALEAMNEKEVYEMKAALETKGEVGFTACTLGKNVSIKKNMVTISKEIKKEHQRVFTPSVIGLSFGIGRIIYCLYEHSFYTRPSKAGDQQLNVLRFPPLVAYKKCTVFPLVQEFKTVAKAIEEALDAAGISCEMDVKGTSMGKRYASTDELGVPFAITVDSTDSVTIRERDSRDQVRVNVDEAVSVVESLAGGHMTWSDVWSKYPHHASRSSKD